MNEAKRKENDAIKSQLTNYFILYRIASRLKKPFPEVFRRQIEYKMFKEKIAYQNT